MSMRYSVELTPQAVGQIQDIVSYISKELLVPNTAKAWADHLKSEMSNLDSLPERYPVVDMEPWRSRGYHVMRVKNYLVYYYIDNDRNIVWVTAVIYGRREQLNALKEGL